MKSIYDFNLNKKGKVEVVEETDKGKLISTIDSETPVKVIFKKPSRLESEESEMVFAIEYGRCVRAGILTKPLIEKLYDEREKSGILSDNFVEKYNDLYIRFHEVQNEYVNLDLKTKKTEEDSAKMRNLLSEFGRIKHEMQNLEASRNSLFQNTAETKAQNRTILWLTLFLTYVQEEGAKTPVAFFKGNTFEEKLRHYDEVIESEDEFSYRLIDRMAFYVALWYLGRASTKEDFSTIDKSLDAPDSNTIETPEIKPEENKSEEKTPDEPVNTEPKDELF